MFYNRISTPNKDEALTSKLEYIFTLEQNEALSPIKSTSILSDTLIFQQIK